MNEILEVLYNAILDGDLSSAQKSVQEALNSGLEPGKVLAEGMIAAMKEVGKRFEEGEYFIPEMLIAALAMQGGLALLKPYLVSGDIMAAGKVAIGTVKGDLHDIGKNLVSLMLEGAGFEVKDLGTDVSPDKYLEALINDKVQIIALSALLTTTMPNMKATIEALEKAGVRDKVKVIVGGAPVTQAYADQIGADGYAADAIRAVALVQSLLLDA